MLHTLMQINRQGRVHGTIITGSLEKCIEKKEYIINSIGSYHEPYLVIIKGNVYDYLDMVDTFKR